MFPDLSYFFHKVFGTEPDNWLSIFKTFGLFLVIAILFAAWLLYLELKRKAAEGKFTPQKKNYIIGGPPQTWDLISNGIFGFILGFKGAYAAMNFAEFQADPAAVAFSAKGNWLFGIIGFLGFAAYRYWEVKRVQLPKPKQVVETIYPHDRIGDITIIAAITGIVGAKLFALIEDLPTFFADPIGTFFSGSGLAIYGGLIGGFIGVYIYLSMHKIKPIHVMDAVAPALIISYGIGRIGCQLSGDGDWGIVAKEQPDWWFLPDWLWSYTYPNNVNRDGIPIEGCDYIYCRELAEGVYPTPLYEIAMTIIIFAFLWSIRKKLNIAGMLFFIYVFLNGLERFIIEKIRVNPVYNDFGIEYTQAEFIAVILMLIGITGGLILRQRAKNGKAEMA